MFGFEAREFLRKLLIGKRVYFIEFPPNEERESRGYDERSYGEMYIIGDKSNKSVRHYIIEAGWGEIKNDEKITEQYDKNTFGQ